MFAFNFQDNFVKAKIEGTAAPVLIHLNVDSNNDCGETGRLYFILLWLWLLFSFGKKGLEKEGLNFDTVVNPVRELSIFLQKLIGGSK